MLGRLRGNLGDLDGAVEAFGLSLTINPDDVEAHHGMSQALEMLGRRAEAAGHRRVVERLTGSALGDGSPEGR